MDLATLRTTHFKYPPSDWERTRSSAKAELIKVARREGTIAYSDLGRSLMPIAFEPDDGQFHAMLGQISIFEHDEGRGMLSALVVNKSGDKKGQPGDGFFELARLLGLTVTDRELFWIEQCRKVYAAQKS